MPDVPSGAANSFYKLLEQALTLGLKRTSKSQVPQILALVVYAGLAGLLSVGLHVGSSQVIAASIALLMVCGILALLIALGTRIHPILLNVLVFVVVLGFLSAGVFAVVKLSSQREPPGPASSGISFFNATLLLANGTTASGFEVTVVGSRTAITTQQDGLIRLPLIPGDIEDGKVTLSIETQDHQWGRTRSVAVADKSITIDFQPSATISHRTTPIITLATYCGGSNQCAQQDCLIRKLNAICKDADKSCELKQRPENLCGDPIGGVTKLFTVSFECDGRKMPDVSWSGPPPKPYYINCN